MLRLTSIRSRSQAPGLNRSSKATTTTTTGSTFLGKTQKKHRGTTILMFFFFTTSQWVFTDVYWIGALSHSQSDTASGGVSPVAQQCFWTVHFRGICFRRKTTTTKPRSTLGGICRNSHLLLAPNSTSRLRVNRLRNE